jgi:hypothetical protein
MREGQDNSLVSDGKSGVAYIQELRFAMYIKRLQNYVTNVMDAEFKRYLRAAGINVDPSIFNIKLPEPENFGIYRQQQLDNDLLSTYGQANGIEHVSKRWGMKKFLQASDEEILMNERMRCEELGLDPNLGKENYPKIYGPAAEGLGGMGGMGGGGGMVAGGGLPGMGGGLEGEMGGEAGGMPAGGAETQNAGAGAPPVKPPGAPPK